MEAAASSSSTLPSQLLLTHHEKTELQEIIKQAMRGQSLSLVQDKRSHWFEKFNVDPRIADPNRRVSDNDELVSCMKNPGFKDVIYGYLPAMDKTKPCYAKLAIHIGEQNRNVKRIKQCMEYAKINESFSFFIEEMLYTIFPEIYRYLWNDVERTVLKLHAREKISNQTIIAINEIDGLFSISLFSAILMLSLRNARVNVAFRTTERKNEFLEQVQQLIQTHPFFQHAPPFYTMGCDGESISLEWIDGFISLLVTYSHKEQEGFFSSAVAIRIIDDIEDGDLFLQQAIKQTKTIIAIRSTKPQDFKSIRGTNLFYLIKG